MAKAPIANLQFKGLYTSGNAYSAASPGQMSRADNMVIRSPNWLESRRGFDTLVTGTNDSTLFPAGNYGNVVNLINYNSIFPVLGALGGTSPTGTPEIDSSTSAIAITDQGYVEVITPAGGTYPISVGGVPPGVTPTPAPVSTVINNSPLMMAPWPLTEPTKQAGTIVRGAQPVPPFKPGAAVLNQSAFVTTANGVVKIGDYDSPDTITSSPNRDGIRYAGAPAPYCLFLGSQTFGNVQPAWSIVAYRVVIGRYDSNGYLLLSAPSQRLVVDNRTSNIGQNTIRCFIPSEVTKDLYPGSGYSGAGWFIQIYRTQNTVYGATYGASGAASPDPGDECFLVYEDTAPVTTYGYYTYTDTQTGAATAVPLYTNANTGSGINNANDRPPLCHAISDFRTYGLFGNTAQPQSLNVNLLGASALTVPNTNAIEFLSYWNTVGSTTYLSANGYVPSLNTVFGATTATVSFPTNIITKTFHVETTLGSAYLNTQATALNFVFLLNAFFHPDNRALLIANGVTPPDINFTLHADYISDYSDPVPGQMLITADALAAPQFIVNVADAAAWSGNSNNIGPSDNAANAAQVMWSLDSQPEAVPLDNFVVVGNPLKPILKIQPLGQSAFIFKQSDGLWQLTGTDPTTFDIRQFDAGINLTAPGSVAVLDGSVYCLTLKGIEVFTESGKLPAPISRPIERDLLALRANNPSFDSTGFAFTYESEGLYILCVPASSSDIGCSLQYVYSNITNTWTRWTLPNLTAGKVMQFENRIWVASGTAVKRERKSLTSADFSDDGNAIVATGQFLPIAPNGPLEEKKWSDVYWSFATLENDTVQLGMYTEKPNASGNSPVTKTGQTSIPWGSFTWGTVPWGGNTQNVYLRQDVPQTCANSTTLSLNFQIGQAQRAWQLQGVSIEAEDSTSQNRR